MNFAARIVSKRDKTSRATAQNSLKLPKTGRIVLDSFGQSHVTHMQVLGTKLHQCL